MTDLPSYKLVQRLMHESGFPVADPNDEMAFPQAKFMKLASRLIQYGADQELEACVELLEKWGFNNTTTRLRTARRPEPPSLKEQALYALDEAESSGCLHLNGLGDTIRRALEALPND